jgi:antitoxin component of RelBE/YafQ-DinJ toxin-antitoxin module
MPNNLKRLLFEICAIEGQIPLSLTVNDPNKDVTSAKGYASNTKKEKANLRGFFLKFEKVQQC